MKKVPGWKIEKDLWSQGYKYVAGIDEVGYGAWAGPVMAAAVVFDPERIVYGMRDSKKINSKSRLGLSGKVKKRSVAWSIGGGSVEEIYDNGLKVARELAFSRAIESLGVKPDYLIVDGLGYQWQDVPSMKIVGGDGISATIAAASIVAKVERDK
ncbi:ribonuclease HII, partial [Patescibacteria group bacterium]|nr:ribonuclease HII [Patescibacteria group bacterium]